MSTYRVAFYDRGSLVDVRECDTLATLFSVGVPEAERVEVLKDGVLISEHIDLRCAKCGDWCDDYEACTGAA